jgi:malonate transporter and related proteins
VVRLVAVPRLGRVPPPKGRATTGRAVTGALLEAALLIALGWALGRWGFAGEAFWRGFDRLVYFVLLPALLLRSLAGAEFSGAEAGTLALSAALSIFALTLFLLAARRALGLEGPAFTSVYQGSVRSNTYTALATVPALYGERGLVLVALLIAAVVPLVNVLSVQGRGGRPGPSEVARSVATNPVIVACALGLLANASGTRLPAGLDGALAALSAAALPCGLMAVGAALSPGALGGHLRGVSLSATAKFLALPLLSLWTGHLLGLLPEALGALVVFKAQPTATASYVLARQLGGDADLMASIVTAQTLLAFAVLPAAAGLLAG